MSGTGRDDRRRRGPRRTTLALLLAGTALLCAVVAALLPAHHLRAGYSWPPPTLPAAQPARLWYTPLLLTRHEPASISAELPCDLPPALPQASRPLVVLATARHPGKAGALAVTRAGKRLVVSVGPDVLTSFDVATASAATNTCRYHLDIAGGVWTVSGGQAGAHTGNVTMPIVDGIFSGLDLRAGSAPSIAIDTTVYNSRTTGVQTVTRIVGALSALTALLLLTLGGGRHRATRLSASAVRAAVARARPVDAVVVLLLLGWWVIGPAFFDDGWVMATQRNFAASGSFTSYYDSFGVTLSLQYWLEWSESWLFRSSHSLLVLRLPALVCLTATWVLCRWIFRRILAAGALRSTASLWALAAGFLVGAFAWGMTLRPEPVLALLVTAVLACTVRFLERASAGPLAVAAVLVALAISAHPAGLVALAPLVVAAPQLIAWARSGLTRASAIAVAAIAILGILVVLGSDFAQLRADAASLRTYGPEIAGWREELSRYTLLSRALYGAPLRREWAALALLCVFAYLLRRRDRPGEPLLDLPSKALGASLLLLLATPSKLPWHFGTLIGFAALAAGSETMRLVSDARRTPGWHIRPFLFIGATMLAAAWSWFPRNSWSDLDLRTLSWTLGIEQRLTFAKAAGLLPLGLLAVVALVAVARSGRGRLKEAPWQASIWSVPLLAVPLIAFTAGVLVADAVKTKSWTLTRQNLQTLKGDLRCGLADDALVPQRGSMQALSAITQPARTVAATWLPPAPVAGLMRFAIGPPPTPTSAARSSWFRLAAHRIGFFLTGTPGASDILELEWGRFGAAGVKPLGAERVPADFATDAEPNRVAWRFYSGGDLPSPPPGANAMRFALRADQGAGTQIGLTAPVTYRDERLITLLERQQPSLALPNLLPYVPCVRQPVVTAAAEAPKAIVAFRDSLWPLAAPASPFAELSEIYSLVRLPLSDSSNPPGGVAVYEVDQQIEGGVSVPAVQRGFS